MTFPIDLLSYVIPKYFNDRQTIINYDIAFKDIISPKYLIISDLQCDIGFDMRKIKFYFEKELFNGWHVYENCKLVFVRRSKFNGEMITYEDLEMIEDDIYNSKKMSHIRPYLDYRFINYKIIKYALGVIVMQKLHKESREIVGVRVFGQSKHISPLLRSFDF
ncbi:MAG: hypothetical protein GWP19_00230 [Planctomycetia bacterium]|nr:hypothetical protein [Planctomycetia bacterium]